MLHWQQLQNSLIPETRVSLDLELTKPSAQTLCFPLDDYQVVTVSGENAATFLQGQCTCNFVTLDENSSTYGSHCTPKGRMVASFVAKRLVQASSNSLSIGLRVHKSSAEILLKSLSKYAVFSKVKVEIDHNIMAFVFMGTAKDSIGPITQREADILQATVFKHGDKLTELWLSKDILTSGLDLQSTYQELSAKNHQEDEHQSAWLAADAVSWQRLQIQRGIYDVRGETTEELLPQEINHQLLGAIDFKKGCYTGQEIIARLHYKGQLKKHMRRAEILFEKTLPPSLANTDGLISRDVILAIFPKNLIGLPLSAVKIGPKIEMLSVVSDSVMEQTKDSISEDINAKITWLPLPYAIP